MPRDLICNSNTINIGFKQAINVDIIDLLSFYIVKNTTDASNSA